MNVIGAAVAGALALTGACTSVNDNPEELELEEGNEVILVTPEAPEMNPWCDEETGLREVEVSYGDTEFHDFHEVYTNEYAELTAFLWDDVNYAFAPGVQTVWYVDLEKALPDCQPLEEMVDGPEIEVEVPKDTEVDVEILPEESEPEEGVTDADPEELEEPEELEVKPTFFQLLDQLISGTPIKTFFRVV